jgi:uncharacterized protein (UPF0333 family)
MLARFLLILGLWLLPSIAGAFDYTFTAGNRPAFTPRVIAYSNVAVPLTGTVAETTMWSYTVPGGMMGANGTLRITALLSMPASANSKTIKVKFGGTLFLSHSPLTSTYKSVHLQKMISNRNSVSSQIGTQIYDSTDVNWSTNVVTTASINTAVDQPLIITGQLGSSGETITLERVTVELIPGAN